MPDALQMARRAFGLEDSSGKMALMFFSLMVFVASARYLGEEACSLLIPRRGTDWNP